MPPEAIAATRCSTSIGMPAACALAMKLSAIAASAMLMPPEAEPVMPARAVDRHRFVDQRVGDRGESHGRRPRSPGSAAITAPKPYSDAVFIDASRAPPIALLLPSAKLAFHLAATRTPAR
jgi:hypothetical protein